MLVDENRRVRAARPEDARGHAGDDPLDRPRRRRRRTTGPSRPARRPACRSPTCSGATGTGYSRTRSVTCGRSRRPQRAPMTADRARRRGRDRAADVMARSTTPTPESTMRRPEIETAARAHGGRRRRRRRRGARPPDPVRRVHGRRAARPHRRLRRRVHRRGHEDRTGADGPPGPVEREHLRDDWRTALPERLDALVAAWRPDDAYEACSARAASRCRPTPWRSSRSRSWWSTDGTSPAPPAAVRQPRPRARGHRRLLRAVRPGATRRRVRTRARGRRVGVTPRTRDRAKRSRSRSGPPAADPIARHTRRSPCPRITPNLWFDTEALEAAEFYTSVFPNSEITNVSHYTDAGPARPARC